MKYTLLRMGTNRFLTAGLVLLVCAALLSTTANADPYSISLNFNGTAIADTSYLWFNSHLKSVDDVTLPAEIYFRNQTISVTLNGQTTPAYILPVPDATVRIGTGPASTTFSGSWLTQVASDSDDPFLSGYAWDVPALVPGGADAIWQGDFYSNCAGADIQWQAAAAVYTSFSTDPSALGVLAIDSGGRQSGTPTAFADSDLCVGGGTGGGSSNFTGSNSPTARVTDLDLLPPVPLPGAVLLGFLGLGSAGWWLRKSC